MDKALKIKLSTIYNTINVSRGFVYVVCIVMFISNILQPFNIYVWQAQSSTLYIYIIYTQSLHQLNLPSSKTCHPSVTRVYEIKTKISNFGYLHILSAHILIWNLQILRMSKWRVAACSVLSPSKSYIIELRRFWLSAYSAPADKFSPPALN